MRGTIQKIIVVLALISLAIFIVSAFKRSQSTEELFKKAQQTTAALATTSQERVLKSMITLPHGDILVQLQNGTNTYMPLGNTDQGVVRILPEKFTTYFFAGELGVWPPRLDVLVPMSVSHDAFGSSMYVVIFWDRGDAAIERSYVRLGDSKTVIEDISFLLPEKVNITEEYRVKIQYRSGVTGASKEAIVPVIDGHFDSNGVLAS